MTRHGATLPVAPSRPTDYSVLTPAVSGRLEVVTAQDVTGFGINTDSNIGRKFTLRDLADANGYDPAPRLQTQLIAALQAAGYVAAQEPMVN